MMPWSWQHNMVFVGLTILVLGMGGYWYYERNKDVLAWVGDLPITKSSFSKEMQYRGGQAIHRLDKQVLLDEMIVKKLLLNKAYKLGYHERADVLRDYEHLLIGKVRKDYIEKKRGYIAVNEDELKNYYMENQIDFRIPQKDRFAILFFKKRDTDVDSNTERLTAVQKLAEAGKLPRDVSKGFGEHAVSHSEHQVSRYKGGDIGWFSKNEEVYWEKGVLDAGFSLKELGDVSEIIETNKGFYLVRLMDRKEATYKEFTTVREKIRHQLILAEQRAVESHFEKSLRESFSVSVNEDKLQQLALPAEFAAEVNPVIPANGMLN